MPKLKLKNAAKKQYSDSELLVYESESSNEEKFNNGKTELSEEEAEQLQCKNKELQEVAQELMSLDNFFKPAKKIEVKYEMSYSDINDSDIENNKTLLVFKQRQQKYIPTLIDDEDVQSSCLHFIYTLGKRITTKKFQNYIQNNVLPHVTSSRTSMSLETARTWLHHLGLSFFGMGSSWYAALCKKEKSKALMISEFLTKTHDHFIIISAKINELNLSLAFLQKAHVIIKPGKNDDGCTNHSAFASDALCTKNMNLYPNSKQSRLHDDLSSNDFNYIFRNQLKGIQQVLYEYNLWPTSGLKLKCENNYYDSSIPNCCVCHLLSAQPNFIMQKSALKELIIE
ncbi:930_t:CDS:2 [Cetraspora pellucida]|uniref:930_t:CDS:1 n=1 Tax=Cetraspora pellucida TaxID=1433469 RepID=A0A9N9N937_9GLOM|nr:930_t:CDS:2 [Cetraspora pellucida]